MKKYKRRISVIPPIIIAIIAIGLAIIAVLIYVFCGKVNEGVIICGGWSVAFCIIHIFIVTAVAYKYSYSEKEINLLYMSMNYRKIKYEDYSIIIISNASYNNGYSDTRCYNLPMQYIVKDKTKKIRITYPFISLHKSEYPVDNLKSGLHSRDLIGRKHHKIIFLGICWFDSFAELLKHSNAMVYVLEDVYLRYVGIFDEMFMRNEFNIGRFYIVTNKVISYKDYIEEKAGKYN